jgi:hypothetical protein
MRSDVIVSLTPDLHKYFRLVQRVQHFSVQKLVPQLPDERLDIAVLPGAPWFDKQSRHVKPVQPLSDSLSREFRAIIRPDILGHSPCEEQLIQPSFRNNAVIRR